MGTTANRKPFNAELIAWVRTLYGPGKLAKSGLELSRNARRNRNTVGTLERDGTATAEVIIDLARAAGVEPLPGLVIGGYLTEKEVGPPSFKVTEAEKGLIQEYRELPVHGQDLALGAIQGMRRSEAGQNESHQMAEAQANRQAGPESQ